MSLAFGVLVVSTFILLFKFWDIREKKRQVVQARKSLQGIETFDDVLSFGATMKGTLPGALVRKSITSLKILLESKGLDGRLTKRDYEILYKRLDTIVDDVVYDQYEYLSFLSISAAVAPLVGLFGTVSGLINAFIAMSQHQAVSIVSIAPGIAEALLTTLAGLFVAIPTLIMYQFLLGQVQDLEQSLAQFADQLGWKIHAILVSDKE
jgi:biopolymer transport protein ExbB/TolQ